MSETHGLPPCPGRPNCVCGAPGYDGPGAVEPFVFPDGEENGLRRVAAAAEKLPRVTLVAGGDTFLRYECRSALLRFVDDLWFSACGKGVVAVRSAARAGYWDFGVNRRRVERLRRESGAGPVPARRPAAPSFFTRFLR